MGLLTYRQLVDNDTPARGPRPVPRWKELFPIGQGGMGSVWAAVRTDSPVVAALKRLRSGDPAATALFLDEARIAERIRNPYVVQTIEHGKDERGHFLAMELLRGQSLRHIMEHATRTRQPVPLEVCVSVFADALRGLAYLHNARASDGTRLGIIHRDVTPANLLVEFRGRTKLLDFGIASSLIQQRTTCAKQVRGKWGYLSPERILGENTNPQSDLWSIGVTLWETLATRRLFPTKNLERAHNSIARMPIPDLRDEGVPDGLWEIVRKALCRDLEGRWQTATEMLRALEVCDVPARDPGAWMQVTFRQEQQQLEAALGEVAGRATTIVIAPAAPCPEAASSAPTLRLVAETMREVLFRSLPQSQHTSQHTKPSEPKGRVAKRVESEVNAGRFVHPVEGGVRQNLTALSWVVILLCLAMGALFLAGGEHSPEAIVSASPLK